MSTTKTSDTETRIAAASRVLGKATATLYRSDPQLAELATKALADVMERFRRGAKFPGKPGAV